MRWVRSWPTQLPPGRAYVLDDMERVVMTDYDYSPLAAIDDDICLLEWDMALGLEDRLAFEQSAQLTPSHVLVAPYKLYGKHYNGSGQPVWAHRRVFAVDNTRWVMAGESHCELFSFGLVYLPRALVRAFLESPAPERGRWPNVKPGDYVDCRFTDQTFSTWHYWRAHQTKYHEGASHVRIAWHVWPVHLHYSLEGNHVSHEQLPVPVLSGAPAHPSGL